ncbi:ABC transporter permease [Acidovorax sp. BLS4]|uniref:ABC transporter permease n=1 Tax=Acidovorax sp. BLS4 TaxID=3273430 RepID=UPI002943BC6C|nr:ABC transporter permease [Paracidovorax avenae]WOI45606.1 ABC transporter permease [Paracidovorax avenae]
MAVLFSSMVAFSIIEIMSLLDALFEICPVCDSFCRNTCSARLPSWSKLAAASLVVVAAALCCAPACAAFDDIWSTKSHTTAQWAFIAAQISARLMLNGLQALIVLGVARLIFGVEVRGSWFTLISFVILGTLAFMAIGFIIAGIAKTPESASPIAGFLSFPMLFFNG